MFHKKLSLTPKKEETKSPEKKTKEFANEEYKTSFAKSLAQEEKVDKLLDAISASLGRLLQMSKAIGKELDEQNKLLDDLDQNVTAATERTKELTATTNKLRRG